MNVNKEFKELTKKWVVAVNRDAFIANEMSGLSILNQVIIFLSNSKKLKPNAVPSLSDFPVHLTVRGRRNLQEEKVLKLPLEKNQSKSTLSFLVNV